MRNPRKWRFRPAALVAVLVLAGLAGTVQAQFYKDKRITILVNYAAGGSTDMEARLVARHLGRHIPGNPGIVVENMPGAGGVAATNHMGEAVEPDGLTVAVFAPPLLQQLLEDPALRVDVSGFVWLAGIGQPQACFVRTDTGGGVAGAEDLLKMEGFRAAGYSPANSTDIRFRLALDLLGARYRYVTGYSVANLFPSLLRNEVQFACATIPFLRSTVIPRLVRPGLGIVLWYYPEIGPDGREVRNRHLEDIPTWLDIHERLRGESPSGLRYEALKLVNNLEAAMQRGVFVPPGTPDEAVGALRLAFAALATDREYIADYTEMAGGPPHLLMASETRALVDSLADADPDTVAFIREFTGSRNNRP